MAVTRPVGTPIRIMREMRSFVGLKLDLRDERYLHSVTVMIVSHRTQEVNQTITTDLNLKKLGSSFVKTIAAVVPVPPTS